MRAYVFTILQSSLRQLGMVQADMLVFIQSVQSVHLALCELEIEDIDIRLDAFFCIGFG